MYKNIFIFKGTITDIDEKQENFSLCKNKYVVKPEEQTDESFLPSMVFCFSDKEYAIGDIVVGIFIYSHENTAYGICLSERYLFLTDDSVKIPAEYLFEHTSYHYNLFLYAKNKFKENWRCNINNDFLNKFLVNNKTEFYSADVCAKPRQIINDINKTSPLFPTLLKNHSSNVKFKTNLNFNTDIDDKIYFLNYIENENSHLFSIHPLFSCWISSLEKSHPDNFEALKEFLTSELFIFMGKNLRISKSNYDSLHFGGIYRAVIVDSSKHLAQLLSIGRPEKMHLTVFPYIPNDKITVTDNDAVTVEAIEQNGETILKIVNLIIKHEKRENKSPQKEGSRKEKIVLPDDLSGLFAVRENEYCQQIDRSGFFPAELCSSIENGSIHGLHFEILNWIGLLNYSTNQFIFRLIQCGMIPEYPHELSYKGQNDLQNIKNQVVFLDRILIEKNTVETPRTISYPTRATVSDKLKLIVSKLERGMVSTGKFTNKGNNATGSTSNILLLTQNGCNILREQSRGEYRANTFGYLYNTIRIKQILSSNQLMIAFFETFLNQLNFENGKCKFSIPLNQIKTNNFIYTKNASSPTRIGFEITIKNNQQKNIIVFGESIRNTCGPSAEFDRSNIEEKYPRLLKTANQYAMEKQEPVILCFVFTNYNEMCFYSERIYAEQEKLFNETPKQCALYFTYDDTILGGNDNTFFKMVSAEDGSGNKLELIDNFVQEMSNFFEK